MRRFQLHRDTDETGTSGTGVVVEGCEFSSGMVALTWVCDADLVSWCWYPDMDRVERIHGHGGKTRVVWLDPPTGRASLSTMAVETIRAALETHPGREAHPVRAALDILDELDRRSR